jgi:hypothetical protein
MLPSGSVDADASTLMSTKSLETVKEAAGERLIRTLCAAVLVALPSSVIVSVTVKVSDDV